ncbi:hypothetical protein SERLA73DRAFT_190518 [Serpula lacrymans var. lacrymans S7.3]|uniref:Uncharacterized protein n=1 Tax=Serpula lacrymans var. lacrymans (strain S7.3) TaxID=936435 RepID=F8QFS2_SERL3|nr:hypothetical protein SERLA73DRAFT_190518 [Serpula lacrymans var. lacrymans S7.3]
MDVVLARLRAMNFAVVDHQRLKRVQLLTWKSKAKTRQRTKISVPHRPKQTRTPEKLIRLIRNRIDILYTILQAKNDVDDVTLGMSSNQRCIHSKLKVVVVECLSRVASDFVCQP